MTWAVAFALTQGLEMPIYWLGTRAVLPPAWRLAVGFGASAATHPIVWFVLPGLLQPTLGYWGFVAIAETFAFVAEALYLRAFRVPNPWIWSLLANATSFGVGMAYYALR
ncbi:MAG: hypothetical protein R3F61_20910 [Myxococcota bacterium]